MTSGRARRGFELRRPCCGVGVSQQLSHWHIGVLRVGDARGSVGERLPHRFDHEVIALGIEYRLLGAG